MWDRAVNVLGACRDAGLKVLFNFVGDPGEIAGVPAAEFEASGAWWAGHLVEWLQDNPGDTVRGFLIQNEFDRRVQYAYNRRYQTVLAQTGDEDLARAEAEAAATEHANRHTTAVRSFCTGVRSNQQLAALVPDLIRAPGGVAAPEGGWARRVLALLEDDVRDGTLTGLAIHRYFNANDFDPIDLTASPVVATLRGDSLEDRNTAFLERLFGEGDPLVTSLPLYVDEYNVNRTSFDVYGDGGLESQTAQFNATLAAFRAVTVENFLDARVALNFPYSPWIDPDTDPDRYDDKLVSIDYAYNAPVQDPLTPQGYAVQDYTSP